MTHEFTLLLTDAPAEGAAFVERFADPLFELFGGDVAPAVSNGAPVLDCAVEADALAEAVRRVRHAVAPLGLVIRAVEVPADAFEPAP